MTGKIALTNLWELGGQKEEPLSNAQNLARATGFAVTRTRAAASPARPFAEIEVYDEPQAARAAWADIYDDALTTPYQSYDFVSVWLRTIGRSLGAEAMIVVVRDDNGETSAILPFCRRRLLGLSIAGFVGGKHANFHMGAFRSGLAVDRGAIDDLLRRIAHSQRIDAFVFVNQPHVWQGLANPFALLGGQASPSHGHSTELRGDLTSWLDANCSKSAQKKLRKKARRLEEQGAVSSFIARDAASTAAVLEAFFAHKVAHAMATGVADDFAETVAKRFLEAAASGGPDGARPVIELHGLRCGDRIVAVFGGLAGADRFCGIVTSHQHDIEIARSSPGELLIHDVVRNLIQRGFRTFDLGVGEARYKDAFCENADPLFDTAITFTFLGRWASAALLLRQRMKAWIKRRPWAWSLATRLRLR
jgi:CelD/BcsL family acetyltransferase involved in cellulose biosynthesis